MARDLIPPPSPAGRPPPDPRPGAFEPVPPEAGAAPAAPAATAAGPSPFRSRFGFLAGALLGCALAAVVLLLVLLSTGDGAREGLAPNWSSWQPSTVETYAGASEIATHVGRGYRDEKKRQLVSVTGGRPALGSLPLSIAVRPRGGDIEVLQGTSVQYTLNGLGNGGSLREGKATKARDRFLRREALELALYSFRYLEDVTTVVALLPPERVQPTRAELKETPKGAGAGDDPKYKLQALLYEADDLQSQLEVPLRHTMAPRPPAMAALTGDEARRVDSLTLSNLYRARITQAQDARPYLVLDRSS